MYHFKMSYPTAYRSPAAKQAFNRARPPPRFAPDGFHPGTRSPARTPARLPWGPPLPQPVPFVRPPAPTPFLPYDPWGRTPASSLLPGRLLGRAIPILGWGFAAYTVYEWLKPNDYARIIPNGPCGPVYLHHTCNPPPQPGSVPDFHNGAGIPTGCLVTQTGIGANSCAFPFGADTFHLKTQRYVSGGITYWDYTAVYWSPNQNAPQPVIWAFGRHPIVPGTLSGTPRPFVPNGYWPAQDAKPDIGTGPSPLRPAPQFRDAPYHPTLPLGDQTHKATYHVPQPYGWSGPRPPIAYPEVVIHIEIPTPGPGRISQPEPHVAVDTSTNPKLPSGGVSTPSTPGEAPERKLRTTGGRAGLMLYRMARQIITRAPGFYSEVNDFVESLYKGLPKKYRKMHPNTVLGRYEAVYFHFDKINWEIAIRELLLNEVQDRIVGRGFGYAQKGARHAKTESVFGGILNVNRRTSDPSIWRPISSLQ